MQLCALSYKYKVKMVPEFLTIAMTVKVAEGVALQLNPDLELSKVAIPVQINLYFKAFYVMIIFMFNSI